MNIDAIIAIAEEAGRSILAVYHQPSDEVQVEYKADDSPLTRADKAAHAVIVAGLTKFYPEIPQLSEEGENIAYEVRKDWVQFWMIDPLDGTKEFVKRNGEFTVNIALIQNQMPVLGVVHIPVSGETYYAQKEKGSFFKAKNGESTKIQAKTYSLHKPHAVIVSSRSHLSLETAAFIAEFSEPELISMGSSLKFMLVAAGKAEVYPRFAPTMEWDTAAAQIIVEEANGHVYQAGTTEPMRYNKENLLNPHFLVTGSQA